MRYAVLGSVIVAAILGAGCVSGSSRQPTAPAPTVRTSGERGPLAYSAGERVTLDDLGPALLEAAGATVLAEHVLDAALAQRLDSRGLAVTETNVAAEEAIVRQSLSEDEDVAARLLADLRERRGLGPVRFAALLKRNAGLRRLVEGQFTVTDPAVRQAYRLAHGPAARVRLIVTPTLRGAQDLRQRAAAGEPFGELAAMNSTDPSAAQGGLLSPIRPDDTSYPQAVRAAVSGLEPGGVSEPLAIDGGFALVKLEENLAGDGASFEEVKDGLAERVRRRAERTLMQQQARELIGGADVTLLDPALNAAWERQREALLGP